jgi:hypothetical protein
VMLVVLVHRRCTVKLLYLLISVGKLTRRKFSYACIDLNIETIN